MVLSREDNVVCQKVNEGEWPIEGVYFMGVTASVEVSITAWIVFPEGSEQPWEKGTIHNIRITG